MTLGVIEPKTSEIICPALEVTTGQKTFEAANREYKGLILPCIHCWEELRRNGTRWLDRGLVEAVEEEISSQAQSDYKIPKSNQEIWANYREEDASLIRKLVAKGFEAALSEDLPLEYDFATEKVVRTAVDATFRKGFFDTNSGKRRWMHFTHNTGRLKGVAQISCHDPSGIDHQVAVGSFQLKLKEEYKTREGIKIVPEKTIVCKPGEPPETRRPDLVVYQNSQIVRVLEIQRSSIKFSSLRERTNNLRDICTHVEWYFSRGIYNRVSMYEIRKWLYELGIEYFYYWYDDKTGKLVYAPGKPPETKEIHRSRNKSSGSIDAKTLLCNHFDSLEDRQQDWSPETEKLTISALGAAVPFQEEDKITEGNLIFLNLPDPPPQLLSLCGEINKILATENPSWDLFLEIGKKYPQDIKQLFWNSLNNAQKFKIQEIRDLSSQEK